jgi:RNA polymerase sigma-70 factor (ECF subfamily)
VTPAESELITRCVVGGDTEAYGELVRRHQSAVRRFLRHLTRGDNAQADDLAQEAFLQAYRNLGRFRGDSRFETWILGIAYNCFRNARRRLDATEPLPEEAPGLVAPAERLSDLQQDLAAALLQLSGDEQLALRLSFQFDLTHEEIAGTLRWPLGTVKTHLARGKAKLRELMSAWNPRR